METKYINDFSFGLIIWQIILFITLIVLIYFVYKIYKKIMKK